MLTARAAPAQQMQMMTPDLAAVIRGVLPCVVNITTYLPNPPGHDQQAASATAAATPPLVLLGSGFIIDPKGVILTNSHVVAGADRITVLFADGTSADGHILIQAPVTDLALVKVDVDRRLPAVRWGDSDYSRVGDPVLAIGNPLGIGTSVSAGIVSAVNRNLWETPYDDFIQTDAAINHGNSGGPLINRQGEVIGVNTAMYSPTTGSTGIGFAIPSNDARYIADRLLQDPDARPAYIGIKVQRVTADMADALGMATPTGAIIAVVQPGGPAAAAGLQVGDVITAYGGQTVHDRRALERAIAHSPAGRPIEVMFLRRAQPQTTEVTPIPWPTRPDRDRSRVGMTAAPKLAVPASLGLRLEALTTDLRARYQLSTHQAGVLVSGVMAGTDAFQRGLVPGDVILRLQDSPVDSPHDVLTGIDTARAEQRAFVAALVLPAQRKDARPRWIALRVTSGRDSAVP